MGLLTNGADSFDELGCRHAGPGLLTVRARSSAFDYCMPSVSAFAIVVERGKGNGIGISETSVR